MVRLTYRKLWFVLIFVEVILRLEVTRLPPEFVAGLSLKALWKNPKSWKNQEAMNIKKGTQELSDFVVWIFVLPILVGTVVLFFL